MEDVARVEIEETIEELIDERFEYDVGDWRADGLGVVVNYLLQICQKGCAGRNWVTDQKIMFRVFEDHVDGFVFQYDLLERDNVLMINLSVQLSRLSGFRPEPSWNATHRNFSDSTLTDPSVGDHIALLVWFEFLDSMHPPVLLQALRLVYSAIRSRGYESEDSVLGSDSAVAGIALLPVKAHGIMLEDVIRPLVEHST